MRASSHMDWIIGFVIFLVAFTIAVNYARISLSKIIPEEEIVKKAVLEIEKILKENKIPMKMYEIEFVNYTLKNYPCEVFISNPENISVVENLYTPKVFEKENNKTRFLADWPGDVMVLESCVKVNSSEGDAKATSSSLSNSNISVYFNSTHILDMVFKGSSWLREASYLDTAQILENKTSPTKALVKFDNANITLDSFSTRIWIFGNAQEINFTINFTEFCYLNESVYACAELSTTSTSSPMISFYNSSSGISFIGNGDKFIENIENETLRINFKNLTKLEIFFQEGNYTLAVNESKAFFENCKIKPYLTVPVLLDEKLNNLNFSLSNVKYRIEILNHSYGENIPLFANVYRTLIPVLIYQNGIINRTYAEVWIWQ